MLKKSYFFQVYKKEKPPKCGGGFRIKGWFFKKEHRPVPLLNAIFCVQKRDQGKDQAQLKRDSQDVCNISFIKINVKIYIHTSLVFNQAFFLSEYVGFTKS